MNDQKNYEIEMETRDEVNEVTPIEEENSKGGAGAVVGAIAGITLLVVGAVALWNKFGPKKNETEVVKSEPIDVESEEVEETGEVEEA